MTINISQDQNLNSIAADVCDILNAKYSELYSNITSLHIITDADVLAALENKFAEINLTVTHCCLNTSQLHNNRAGCFSNVIFIPIQGTMKLLKYKSEISNIQESTDWFSGKTNDAVYYYNTYNCIVEEDIPFETPIMLIDSVYPNLSECSISIDSLDELNGIFFAAKIA